MAVATKPAASSGLDPEAVDDLPELLDRVRSRYREEEHSPYQEPDVILWVKQYVTYHGFDELGAFDADHIRTFLSHLAVEEGVRAAEQDRARKAIQFFHEDVLGQDLGTIEEYQRPDETAAGDPDTADSIFLECPDGQEELLVQMLRHTDADLAGLLRLRVRDVSFADHEIILRDSAGEPWAVARLPEQLHEPLREQLKKVRALHEEDCQSGGGAVYLPPTIAERYPGVAPEWAERDWAWQYVFPAPRSTVDLRNGRMRRYPLTPEMLPYDLRQLLEEEESAQDPSPQNNQASADGEAFTNGQASTNGEV
jgi:hypothetical protein